MPTTTHCAPNRRLKASMRSGSASAGELTDTFSAPDAEHLLGIGDAADAARHAERNIQDARNALDPGAIDGASLRARGDVVEHELIGALVAVAARKVEDVPDDAMIVKAHPFDDLAVAHVQAGDYAFGKNGRSSSTGNEILEQRLAADRRRCAARRQGFAGPRASRTPPDACQAIRGKRRAASA